MTAQQVNSATGTTMGNHFTSPAAQPRIATAVLFDALRPFLPEVPAEIEALVAQRTVESGNFASRDEVSKRTVSIRGGSWAQMGNGGRYKLGDHVIRETVAHTPEAKQWSGWGTALKPAFEPIVMARKPLAGTVASNVLAHGTGALNIDACRTATRADRWPANVVLDQSQAEVLGEPARFFYAAKAGKGERPIVEHEDGTSTAHPTVKPVSLMRWLVRLITPPGGVVLEPFAGSGSTVEACILEHFECIAIEQDSDYLPLIEQRIDRVTLSGCFEGDGNDAEGLDPLSDGGVA